MITRGRGYRKQEAQEHGTGPGRSPGRGRRHFRGPVKLLRHLAPANFTKENLGISPSPLLQPETIQLWGPRLDSPCGSWRSEPQFDKPGTLCFFQHTSLNTLCRPTMTAAQCLLNRKKNNSSSGLFYPNSQPYSGTEIRTSHKGRPSSQLQFGGPGSNRTPGFLLPLPGNPSCLLPPPHLLQGPEPWEEAVHHLCGLIKVIVRIF